MMAGHHSKLQVVVVTALIISLVSLEVHSQTSFPYITLKGKTLRNNSWIEVGTLQDDKLQCVTDSDSCCEDMAAVSAWILPNGTELSKDGVREISSFMVEAGPQQLGLKLVDGHQERNTALPGVYECSIATRTAASESVYVGIYHGPDVGSLLVSGPVFSGDGLPSTLTCVSSNLPATTVEWTLNGNTLSDALTTSVLTDPLTSQYTHTLTLTERQGGVYGCSLSAINDDSMTPVNSSSATVSVLVGAPPLDVSAFQMDPTSVHVFWTQPEPIGQTVGYQIYYTGPTSGNVSVDDIDANNQTITGLVNGELYRFSVAGKSAHFESEPIAAEQNPVGLTPGAPELILRFASGDSVTVSWSVPSGTVVEMYELMWVIEGPPQPVEIRNTVSSSTHRYSVPVLGLFENVTVTITVTSVTAVGSNSSLPLTVHSDIIQSVPAESTGAFIGGLVGVFFVGLTMGVVSVIIVSRLMRSYEKEKEKQTPLSAHPPINQQTAAASNENSTPKSTSSDPSTVKNVAYSAHTIDDPLQYDYVDY